MTSFRFLHAADLHLGSPFSGLAVKDAELAERFAKATRDAFSELVGRAIDADLAFAVIAGDVYDGEWKDNSIGLFFNREIARLDRAGIPVFLLRGNHDAASVVTRSISMPESVQDFDTRKPSSHVLEAVKVALHGQGFAERAATENLALTYPAPVPGHFNIGVLHSSLTGRPPHANYAPCTVEDLKSRGYDYWALGHVHDYEVVSDDPYIVYPGNLQGRSIREPGARGAVVVTVEDGRVVDLDRVLVDQARFAVAEVDVSRCEDETAILREAEHVLGELATVAGDMLHAVRIRLTGETPQRRRLLAKRVLLAEEMQAACHRVHDDFWLEKLSLDLSDPREGGRAAVDDLVELAALIDAVIQDPDLVAEVQKSIEEIRARLPMNSGEDGTLFGEAAETLLAEARDVALARAAGPDSP